MSPASTATVTIPLAGIIPCSMVDYPGRPAVVAFTQGCAWRCPFCHNGDLLSTRRAGRHTPADLYQLLDTRPERARAVVISGGEPTVHVELPTFLRELRGHAAAVKLDTNGSNPDALGRILDTGLVDYVAMDWKAPAATMAKAAGVAGIVDRVRESLRRLLAAGVSFEVRTTVVPGFHEPADFSVMAEELCGVPHWFLQPFQPPNARHAAWRRFSAPDRAFLEACANAAAAVAAVPVSIRT